jgi:tripartite-type tricarboxylate transporter receptor subunit TctC
LERRQRAGPATINRRPFTLPDIVNRLNASINEILRSPELEASLAKFNAKPKIGSPQDFTKFWRAETEKWTNVITLAGIKAD